MGTSAASAGSADPGNEQSVRRTLVEKCNQVRNGQATDSDRRFLITNALDLAVAKLTVLKICPGDSPGPWVNRQGSTEAFCGYDSVCHEYFSLGSNDSRLLSEARTRSS